MFFGNVEKVEITTDKNVVNALLKDGWYLVDVISTFKREYLFLLGFCNDFRAELLGLLKAKSNSTSETS